jgi:acetyl-CoA carboxylase biotin carboxylase subunit
MRVVEKEDQMESLFFACENEAVNAFANGELYMEKFIHNPRHIEVQILADKHGNVIHLGERDCSMQRRHQKLIEETPATVLTQEQRDELVNVAVKAAKFIKYENAGTFEFLVDKNNNFYFMEMNTRLQVEHPVSEYVSGLDVVEWMIKIAQGEKLPKQQDIVLNGHSLECRITAEDSVTFAPSPGKITKWIAPGGRNVRVDSHAYSGYVVPPHYDSMIGKLIVWGKDREEAISTMKRALDEFQVEGIKTSIDFHKKMMLNQDFITNNYDTKYLDSQK